MKVRELQKLLKQLDIHPSKKLGQNFLVDGNLLRLIVRVADPQPDQLIVEIGPGTGVLTEGLLESGCRIKAIEYDIRLVDYLRKRFAREPRLELIQADATRVNFDELVGGEPYNCVANLPYSISTVALGTLMETANRPKRMCFLLQREMGERIAANPPGKVYGALSVRAQVCYDVKIERIVPPTVFMPSPDVDSAIVTLQLREDALSPAEYLVFSRLVKRAFSQRRKKMAKLLRQDFPAELLTSAMEEAGIAEDARAEQVTVAQYRDLYQRLL